MTHPGDPGRDGTDAGTSDLGTSDLTVSDAELEELRRTHPRRAARILAARGAAAEVPVSGAGPGELFDQHATEPVVPEAQPHDGHAHDGHAHDGDAHDGDAHDEYAQDEYHQDGHGQYAEDGSGHEAYAPGGYAQHPGEVHPGEVHPGEVHPGEVPHDWDPTAVPPDDSYLDDDPHAFGDPVSDGYVAPVVYAAPSRRRRRPRWVGLLALVVLTAVVGAAGWYAWQGLKPVVGDLLAFDLFDAPDDYTGAGEGSVEVVVAPGDTGAQMGRTLVDAGVVASVEAFVAAANAEPEFTSVQPGRYTLPQQLPATDAVASLLDPANRVTDTVVIAEGLRVGQILDRLAERTGLPREDLQAALDAAELPLGVRETEGLIDPAEGLLYPDGYQFGENPTAEGVIQAMLDRGQQVLDELGVPPEQRLEVLTKASLVQGEARIDEDFGKVAQVVDNRLAIDQPLGLDSTINYATQTFDTRTTAEQRAVDSPFNTYDRPGLPPGPIKSPGRQAIEAVAEPTPGPWLYFVAVNLCTGETLFAETFEEHQRNVGQLNAWQRENTVDGQLVCG